MTSFFTDAESSLLVRLLIAHCLTDFFLQSNKWVAEKKKYTWRSSYLWYHGLLTGLLTWIFIGTLSLWWAALFIAVTHTLIDGIKLTIEKRKGSGLTLFLLDQLSHIVFIVITWLFVINGWQAMNESFSAYLLERNILWRLFGYLLMAGPVGYIIQFLTRKWVYELNPEDSLKDAGKWIGILERILTLTFVYIGQFGAIGFLITAKSLLRVIDKPDKPSNEPTLTRPFSSRKRTEYVLIGTFLSFSIAIITGLVINWLLAR
jgi:hypothetical protein